MRRVFIRAAVAALALLAPALWHGLPAQTTPMSARVIVKYRVDSPLLRKHAASVSVQQKTQAQSLGQRIGIELAAGRAITDRSSVVFGRGMTSQQLAARIAAESDVEYAVADEKKYIAVAPNDSYYAGRAVTATSGGPAVGQWY
ncbi:MAG: hypothetical protein ABI364_09480, partial [Caldimonas sp.]